MFPIARLVLVTAMLSGALLVHSHASAPSQLDGIRWPTGGVFRDTFTMPRSWAEVVSAIAGLPDPLSGHACFSVNISSGNREARAHYGSGPRAGGFYAPYILVKHAEKWSGRGATVNDVLTDEGPWAIATGTTEGISWLALVEPDINDVDQARIEHRAPRDLYAYAFGETDGKWVGLALAPTIDELDEFVRALSETTEAIRGMATAAAASSVPSGRPTGTPTSRCRTYVA